MEWTRIQRQVFESIKAGTETLKALNDQITLADVEDVLADTQEAMDQQKVYYLNNYTNDIKYYGNSNFLEENRFQLSSVLRNTDQYRSVLS